MASLSTDEGVPVRALKPGPRLIASDGEMLDPENGGLAGDEITDAEMMVDDGFCAAKVRVDRDELRGLRLSDAAIEVAEKSKGAQALAEIRSRKGGPDHVHRVNPYDLEFEPDHNPRDFTTDFMRQRVVAMSRSIAARGVRVPLDVYVKDGRMFINGGETRWRSTMHCLNFLGVRVERVPVIISQGESAVDRMIGQWIGNDQIQFNPLESGRLFRDAIDLGADEAEIARRIGKPKVYVQNRVRLLEMPRWLIDRVRDGTIKADTAYHDIWLPSGEDDLRAKTLLKGAVDSANEAGARRVMPKHIREAGGRGRITTASSVRDELPTILKHYTPEAMQGVMSEEHTEALFTLAKL